MEAIVIVSIFNPTHRRIVRVYELSLDFKGSLKEERMKYVIGAIALLALLISVGAYQVAHNANCAVKGDEIIAYWDNFPGHGLMDDYVTANKTTLNWVEECGDEDKEFTNQVNQSMKDAYRTLLREG